jgi:DNA-binding Xre family transcriptional regulator
MPVEWNLKKWLVIERNIYRPSELQALIAEKTGVHLSLQAISALVNGKPSGMRFQTMQVVCNALDCNVCEFFSIAPDSAKEQQKQRKVAGGSPKRLYGGKVSKVDKKPDSIFPDPRPSRNNEADQQGKK